MAAYSKASNFKAEILQLIQETALSTPIKDSLERIVDKIEAEFDKLVTHTHA